MLGDILDALACPYCGGKLGHDGATVRCGSGHAFDLAREGYLNLLRGDAVASTADTPAMVNSRRTFLDAGHFSAIARAVADAACAAADDVPGVVLDAGAGTGYVLGAVLDSLPARRGIALDISKHAIRVAARSHERLGGIVADVWSRLPVQDESCVLVLNVFAPRNAEEFARVLTPGGALLVVTPNEDHLVELVHPLGLITVDPRKDERLAAKLGRHFERVGETVLSYRLALSHADAIAAAEMGPSAAHVVAEELAQRVRRLEPPITVTVSVTVGTYVPRSEAGTRT